MQTKIVKKLIIDLKTGEKKVEEVQIEVEEIEEGVIENE